MDSGAEYYRRFLAGDESGLASLIAEYKDGLLFYLNSFVNNMTVAEELTEDTFVRLGVRKPKYKGDSAFRTWLYAIGRHIALDYLRHSRRHAAGDWNSCIDLADEQQLEETYLQEEQKIALHRAMAALKAEYRQILWLTYFEDMSNRDAARIMKKSLHATEVLLSRARQSLKKELEKEGFCYED